MQIKKVLPIIVFVLLFNVLFTSIQAQEVESKYTVYIVANMNGSPFPLQAHIIVGNNIVPAEEWLTPRRGGGPVGLAVDDDNSRLYVSYEVSGVIDVFNARTLVPIDDPGNPGNPLQITLPGATDVAGMVVSELRGRLYAVNRGNTQLYVYDSSTYTRIPGEEFALTGTYPFGIDVWGNRLYVTSGWVNGQTIRYFNLDTGVEAGNFTISDPNGAMAITVDGSDPNNVLVFTTWTTQSQTNGNLTKYNVNTSTESTVALNADGRGVSVEPTLNLVYVGCSESPTTNETTLRVYDQTTLVLQDSELLSVGWTASDVVASRIQFGGSVAKTCTSHPGGIAAPGDTVTFNIDITNNSTATIDVLPLRDTYDTTYLQFLSASVAPDSPANDGQLDWSDLTVALGNIAVDGVASITVNFRALATTPNPTSNVAQTIGVIDEFASPIPDAAGAAAIEIAAQSEVRLRMNAGAGGTTDPAPGNHRYPVNANVQVTALPNPGYAFSGWTGDVPDGMENYSTISIRMSGNRELHANFEKQYSLTLSINNEKFGSTNPGPGTHWYNAGSVASISAIPATHYEFCGWSGDVPTDQMNDNPLNLAITADKSLSVCFRRKIYAPGTLIGEKVLNRSLAQAEYISVLKWTPNTNNVDITKYRIYRIENDTQTLAGEVSASTHVFLDRKVLQMKEYTYAVVAVNSEDREGAKATVLVK